MSTTSGTTWSRPSRRRTGESEPGGPARVPLSRRRRAAGFARTIYQARQFVVHRHVLVNGRRVDRPSYRLRPGDAVAVADRSRAMEPFLTAAAGAHADRVPPYLEVRHDTLTARLARLPERTGIPVVRDEQLVVEYYSR